MLFIITVHDLVLMVVLLKYEWSLCIFTVNYLILIMIYAHKHNYIYVQLWLFIYCGIIFSVYLVWHKLMYIWYSFRGFYFAKCTFVCIFEGFLISYDIIYEILFWNLIEAFNFLTLTHTHTTHTHIHTYTQTDTITLKQTHTHRNPNYQK